MPPRQRCGCGLRRLQRSLFWWRCPQPRRRWHPYGPHDTRCQRGAHHRGTLGQGPARRRARHTRGCIGGRQRALGSSQRVPLKADRSVFVDKSTAVLSACMSGLGAMRSQQHLKVIVLGMGTSFFPWPEVSGGRVSAEAPPGHGSTGMASLSSTVISRCPVTSPTRSPQTANLRSFS